MAGKAKRLPLAADSSANAKRQAILRGAKDIFLKNGFGGASMDAVAAQTGVSKMTLYRYFDSKEDLFAGVITQLCEKIVDEDLEQVFRKAPREALHAFAQKMMRIVFARETIELHRIVIAESRRFPKLGRLFYARGPAKCVDVLTSYFERHRGHPRLTIDEPRRSAEEFLELLRGYAHLRVLLGLEKAPTADEIKARIDGAVRHILR